MCHFLTCVSFDSLDVVHSHSLRNTSKLLVKQFLFVFSIKFECEYEFQDFKKSQRRLETESKTNKNAGKLRTVKWQWIQLKRWHWIICAFPFNVQWCTRSDVCHWTKRLKNFCLAKSTSFYWERTFYAKQSILSQFWLMWKSIAPLPVSRLWFVHKLLYIWHPSYALSLLLVCISEWSMYIVASSYSTFWSPFHSIYSLVLAINYFYFDNSLLLHIACNSHY